MQKTDGTAGLSGPTLVWMGRIGAVAWALLVTAWVQAQGVSVKITETSETPQAVVLAVNGKCESSSDGVTFTPMQAGQIFEEGAVVRTGQEGRTDLFFRRIGTTVRLQSGTEVKLEKMTRRMKDGQPVMNTLLDLRTGRIFTVVRSLVPGSTIEIRNAAGRSVMEGGEIGRAHV